jgi:hypothetical protein
MLRKLDHVALTALDGGLDHAVEYPSTTAPAAGYAENDGLWIWDDTQSIGIHTWLRHSAGPDGPPTFERITVFLPDGTLLVHTDFPERSGHAAGITVGPVEPFRAWRHVYDGTAVSTTPTELRDGRLPADLPTVELHIDATATMTAPPWVQGGFYASSEEWRTTPAGHFHGGFRFEQLLTGTATVIVDDRQSYSFGGDGLRTHRKGARVVGTREGLYDTFPGHIWLDAQFPSGRAFYVKYFPGPEGEAIEGGECWVREGGVFYRAELSNPPLFVPSLPGENSLAFDLDSEIGTVHIDGEIRATSFATLGGTLPDWWGLDWNTTADGALAMDQAFVRYRWGDEVGCNMMERSLPIRRLRTEAS